MYSSNVYLISCAEALAKARENFAKASGGAVEISKGANNLSYHRDTCENIEISDIRKVLTMEFIVDSLQDDVKLAQSNHDTLTAMSDALKELHDLGANAKGQILTAINANGVIPQVGLIRQAAKSALKGALMLCNKQAPDGSYVLSGGSFLQPFADDKIQYQGASSDMVLSHNGIEMKINIKANSEGISQLLNSLKKFTEIADEQDQGSLMGLMTEMEGALRIINSQYMPQSGYLLAAVESQKKQLEDSIGKMTLAHNMRCSKNDVSIQNEMHFSSLELNKAIAINETIKKLIEKNYL